MASWLLLARWVKGDIAPAHTVGRGLGYSTEESRLILSKERDRGGGSRESAAPGSREPLWAPGPPGASPGPRSALFAFPGGFSPRSVCCPSLLSSLGTLETSALIKPEWPGAAGQRWAIAFISTCPPGSRLGPDGGELPLPERLRPCRPESGRNSSGPLDSSPRLTGQLCPAAAAKRLGWCPEGAGLRPEEEGPGCGLLENQGLKCDLARPADVAARDQSAFPGRSQTLKGTACSQQARTEGPRGPDPWHGPRQRAHSCW